MLSQEGDKPVRSIPQNAAIHLYCSMLAESLNNSGLDVMTTLKHDIAIPWTMELVKGLIWKVVQKAMIDEKSTTKLDTSQVSAVYDVINRHMIEKHTISVIFPSKEKS